MLGVVGHHKSYLLKSQLFFAHAQYIFSLSCRVCIARLILFKPVELATPATIRQGCARTSILCTIPGAFQRDFNAAINVSFYFIRLQLH